MDEDELREKAAKMMQDAVDSQESNDEGQSSGDGEEDDGVIKMDFSNKAKAKASADSKGQKKEGKGIQAMKFMQKSDDKQREQNRNDTELAIAQVKNTSFVNASDKFGSKKLDLPA